MEDGVRPEEVRKRWSEIRKKWNLSLSPEAVAEYLKTPESEIVRERILETLIHLGRWRIKQREFKSQAMSGGDLAICEGLEAFLVPAVEGALTLSDLLKAMPTNNCDKQVFADAVVADVNGLLSRWIVSSFSGEPYANPDDILGTLQPIRRQEIKKVDIVESAAMACRVTTHLLTLKLVRHQEAEFRTLIGDKVPEHHLFTALIKAVEFLIKSFRKGPGETEQEKIASASIGTQHGSGWSWTDWPDLPPMLFFTAAAVDAFAELDLYLIRVAESKEPIDDAAGQKKIIDFYNIHQETFALLQLCVDMARRWVRNIALADLSSGWGFYPEPEVRKVDVLPEGKDAEFLKQIKSELERAEVPQMPTLLYHNLYALQVLLWGWADRSESGTGTNDEVTTMINRALAQLVYNYDRVPVIKSVLADFDYVMELPGGDYCTPGTDKKRRYLDSGFLPLLTRLLVLFVVYGVGDRNLLEPVIRNLYIELLQSRIRENLDFTALWSTKTIEIFSTQRAVQALTFYFAYAAGKEQVEIMRGGRPAGGDGNLILLRNTTGFPLIFEAKTEGVVAPPPTNDRVMPDPERVTTFPAYCREIPGHSVGKDGGQEDVRNMQLEITDEGDRILAALKEGRTRDPALANSILYMLARIQEAPMTDGRPRSAEFRLLSQMAGEIISA